jgi:hypothetical protein
MEITEMYRVLGLVPGARLDTIKSSYRRLAKKLHPDLGGGREGEFNRINEAYRGLIDHRRRQTVIAAPLRKQPEPMRPARSFHPVNIFTAGEHLLKNENPLTRALSARNLGLSGKTAAYVFLKTALCDPDERVVRASVRAIAQLRIMQSGDELAALFGRSVNDLKMEILLAVQRMGEPALFSSIIRAGLRDANGQVRGKAEALHHLPWKEATSGTR